MKAARICVALIAAVFAGFPYLWMVSSAFKPDAELFAHHLVVWPRHPTWAHFGSALGSAGLGTAFANSLIVGFATTIVTLAVAAPAAYALVRYRFAGRSFFAGTILAVQF